MPAHPRPTHHLGRLTPNALGAIYMVVGSLGYVVNDALIRAATDEGLGVYQALCLRGIAMTALFAAMHHGSGGRLDRAQLAWPLLLRVAAELVATALFFGALIRLDFANAQTILLIVPFTVTLAAALVLNEPVTARHYGAVAVGFVGVVLVVQPATSGFSAWSIAVIGSAVCLTVRELATKRVPDSVPTSTIALLTASGITVLTGVLALATGWHPITAQASMLVALACVCLMIGYVFTIRTVRVGDLSVSAPFRYTTLIGAVVLGYLLFDELPNALTMGGCVVIVLAGLYAIRLDRRSAERPFADERRVDPGRTA